MSEKNPLSTMQAWVGHLPTVEEQAAAAFVCKNVGEDEKLPAYVSLTIQDLFILPEIPSQGRTYTATTLIWGILRLTQKGMMGINFDRCLIYLLPPLQEMADQMNKK